MSGLFRHLVFFKWSNEASLTKLNSVRQALMTLPGQIPNIAYYNVYNCVNDSTNQSEYPVNKLGYSTVIDSLFDTKEALLNYGPHPSHQSVISTYIKPMLAGITVVDYELDSSIDIETFKRAQHSPHFRHITLLKPKSGVSVDELKQAFHIVNNSSKTNPHISAAWAGSQSLSQWPESYGDRSQGYHLCFETTLDQKGSWRDYVDHPAHKDTMEAVMKVADVTEPFSFDYEL